MGRIETGIWVGWEMRGGGSVRFLWAIHSASWLDGARENADTDRIGISITEISPCFYCRLLGVKHHAKLQQHPYCGRATSLFPCIWGPSHGEYPWNCFHCPRSVQGPAAVPVGTAGISWMWRCRHGEPMKVTLGMGKRIHHMNLHQSQQHGRQ